MKKFNDLFNLPMYKFMHKYNVSEYEVTKDKEYLLSMFEVWKKENKMNSEKEEEPRLFGLSKTNRCFSKKEDWGKNKFNSSFPASLLFRIKKHER
ncbi:MAG: hypothetical protein Q9M28_02945 [Mariprofundaceae bacterium]|nr:hypothetical protein [Mariprofundaceae bacterium]